MNAPRLDIVVPCYNEQEVLPETCKRLLEVLTELERANLASAHSRIVFVDDGSKDTTWALIAQFATVDPRVAGVKLSRNRGHQLALLAGLFSSDADAIISIDADLQDDLQVIVKMMQSFAQGYEIVYGVRAQRDTDTKFKRSTALAYYGLMRKFGVDLVHNHADFRLLSRRALNCLKQYREVNLFLRGLVPQLGFRSAVIPYDRAARHAGESKYPLSKMLALAIDGITSLSAVPLRLISGLGIAIFIGSIGLMVWVLWTRLFTDNAVPGWASIVIPMVFLGGIQLLSLGVLGEYVAKSYLETKMRPRFFVETFAGSLHRRALSQVDDGADLQQLQLTDQVTDQITGPTRSSADLV